MMEALHSTMFSINRAGRPDSFITDATLHSTMFSINLSSITGSILRLSFFTFHYVFY